MCKVSALFALFAVSTLTACASSTSTPSPAPRVSTPATTGTEGRIGAAATMEGQSFEVVADTRGSVVLLGASPDQVWAALPGVYEELGLGMDTSDRSAGQFGNKRVAASRRLAGQAISKLLRCGITREGAPVADMYRIRASVLTAMAPTATGGTQARTVVQAAAANPTGTSTAPVVCESTGVLENQIASEIRARVGG